MLSKEDFERKFIEHMEQIVGRDDTVFYSEVADSSYEMYLQDPEAMTPEEHVEAEISEWGR